MKIAWQRFWTRFAGPYGKGRFAARMAAWKTRPYHCKMYLADFHPRGYVAHTATIAHYDFRMGKNVYVGDGVFAYRSDGGGPVDLRDGVHLYGDTKIQTGAGGFLEIGERTHVQPGCYFSAYVSRIVIGKRVEIAPQCSFYCYDHGVDPNSPISEQPLVSRGGITIGDDAWLGHGATILDGANVGAGAVIGAGSVVVRDIPDMAIAVGSPAKVMKYRE